MPGYQGSFPLDRWTHQIQLGQLGGDVKPRFYCHQPMLSSTSHLKPTLVGRCILELLGDWNPHALDFRLCEPGKHKLEDYSWVKLWPRLPILKKKYWRPELMWPKQRIDLPILVQSKF
jgi:hypothetical protein